MKNLFLSAVLLVATILSASGQGQVDTVLVYSKAMQKNLKAAVTTPSSYSSTNKSYPVLYLLHGGSGAFSDWHKQVTKPGLVNQLADQYDLIIVTPGVGPASYYYDSPILDSV